MAKDRLAGCRCKIERANEHIKNLEPMLKALSDNYTCKVVREYDAETEILSFVARFVKDFPSGFAITIGEALYQLRSCLDHLVWQLILTNRKKPNKRRAFPIFADADEYKATGTSMIKGVSTTAATSIKKLQPFQRGAAYKTDNLWLLGELNNIDKHRFLLVTRAFIGEGSYDFFFEPAITGKRVEVITRGPLKDGTPLARFHTKQREVNMSGKIAIAIALADVGDSKNEPAIPLLTQLSGHVSSIIDSFESEFA